MPTPTLIQPQAVPNRLLRVEQLKSLVPYSRATILRWSRLGKMPRQVMAGAWLASDIENWLAAKGETDG